VCSSDLIYCHLILQIKTLKLVNEAEIMAEHYSAK